MSSVTRPAVGPIPAAADAQRLRLGSLLLLAGLSLCWGLNWPAMKVVLGEMPLLTFRVLCLFIPGPLLLAIAALGGERLRIPRAERVPLVAAAFFNVTCWHLLTATAISLMEPGRAGIIAFTMPIWSALFAAYFLREPLTGPKIGGLVLGVLGLACLIVPDAAKIAAAPWGTVAIVGASLTWASGTMVMKRVRWTMGVAQLTGWQLLVGGIPILVAALLHDDLRSAFEIDPRTGLVLLFILVMPMVFAQWAWFKLLRLLPASIASIGTLAVPVVGILSSAAFLGERIGPLEVLALVFVVAALALVLIVGQGRKA